MFSENFLSFESYMSDNITVSVYQDHILYDLDKIPPKTKDNDEEPSQGPEEDQAAKKKKYTQPVFLPLRLILGRKSLAQERITEFANQSQRPKTSKEGVI